MEIFGFQDESFMRPKTLPYPGAFLRCGSTQIHLMQLPSMDPKTGRPEHGGRDRHVALTVDNIDILRDRLVERGMAYTYSQSGRRALFCRDLDGNAYEFMEDTSLA
jgi:glyoxylase I family protein